MLPQLPSFAPSGSPTPQLEGAPHSQAHQDRMRPLQTSPAEPLSASTPEGGQAIEAAASPEA